MKRMAGVTWTLTLAAAIATVGAASAFGRVVLGVSINGVRLGMSKAQVEKRLGPKSGGLPGTGIVSFKHDLYVVGFGTGGVYGLQTHDPSQKTSTGVGVGSTLAQVKKGIPGVKCSGPKTQTSCKVPGGPSPMAFLLANGRVNSINLGLNFGPLVTV